MGLLRGGPSDGAVAVTAVTITPVSTNVLGEEAGFLGSLKRIFR